MRFVLVDICFQDDAWWQKVLRTRGREPDVAAGGRGLPVGIAEDLMYETLTLCWQMAGSSRNVAMSAFAMSPAVVDMIASLTPRDVRDRTDPVEYGSWFLARPAPGGAWCGRRAPGRPASAR